MEMHLVLADTVESLGVADLVELTSSFYVLDQCHCAQFLWITESQYVH